MSIYSSTDNVLYGLITGARSAQAITDSALAEAKRVVSGRLGGKSSSGSGSGGGHGGSGGSSDVVELTDANFEKVSHLHPSICFHKLEAAPTEFCF